MKKFKLASQERIAKHGSTAGEFFRTVLNLDYRECLVTDESRLVDFASSGMPDDLADATDSLKSLYEAWDAWVLPVLRSRYAVDVASPSVLLVELFEQIEATRGRVEQGTCAGELGRSR